MAPSPVTPRAAFCCTPPSPRVPTSFSRCFLLLPSPEPGPQPLRLSQHRRGSLPTGPSFSSQHSSICSSRDEDRVAFAPETSFTGCKHAHTQSPRMSRHEIITDIPPKLYTIKPLGGSVCLTQESQWSHLERLKGTSLTHPRCIPRGSSRCR